MQRAFFAARNGESLPDIIPQIPLLPEYNGAYLAIHETCARSTVTAAREKLAQSALEARRGAYAPYSGVTVGAALEANGEIFTGANVENGSFGLTVCAERVAVFKAVTRGVLQFSRIAIASNQERFLQPCGACLQVLSEFCDDLEIILVDNGGDISETSLRQLFPAPFKLEK